MAVQAPNRPVWTTPNAPSLLSNKYSYTSKGTTTFTATTATDPLAAWATNGFVGAVVTAGGKTMVVTSNTSTVLTGAAWVGGTPGGGTAFTVVAKESFTLHCASPIGDAVGSLAARAIRQSDNSVVWDTGWVGGATTQYVPTANAASGTLLNDFELMNIGGGLLCIGGAQPGGAAGTTHVVDVWSTRAGGLSAGNWSHSAYPLPLALSQSAACVAVVNGQPWVYVVGGVDSAGVAYSTVFYAPMNADGSLSAAWVQGPSIPAARGDASVCVATSGGNQFLVVTGGLPAGQTTEAGGIGGTPSAAVYWAYLNADGSIGPTGNPSSAWTTATSMGTARYGHTSVFVNGSVLVVGGYTGAAFAGCESATVGATAAPAQQPWTYPGDAGFPDPVGRLPGFVQTWLDKPWWQTRYGIGAPKTASSATPALGTFTWAATANPTLPTPVAAHGMVVIPTPGAELTSAYIVVVGGISTSGGAATTAVQATQFNNTVNGTLAAWQTLTALPVAGARGGAALAQVEGINALFWVSGSQATTYSTTVGTIASAGTAFSSTSLALTGGWTSGQTTSPVGPASLNGSNRLQTPEATPSAGWIPTGAGGVPTLSYPTTGVMQLGAAGAGSMTATAGAISSASTTFTAGPPGTATDSTAAWPVNGLAGLTLTTTAGATLTVASNTATVITGTGAWTGGTPTAGTKFIVGGFAATAGSTYGAQAQFVQPASGKRFVGSDSSTGAPSNAGPVFVKETGIAPTASGAASGAVTATAHNTLLALIAVRRETSSTGLVYETTEDGLTPAWPTPFGVTSVSDTGGNTWTRVDATEIVIGNQAASQYHELIYEVWEADNCVSPGTLTITPNANGGTASLSAEVLEWKYLKPSSANMATVGLGGYFTGSGTTLTSSAPTSGPVNIGINAQLIATGRGVPSFGSQNFSGLSGETTLTARTGGPAGGSRITQQVAYNLEAPDLATFPTSPFSATTTLSPNTDTDGTGTYGIDVAMAAIMSAGSSITVSSFQVGDQFIDGNGVTWTCTVAGNPGTWTSSSTLENVHVAINWYQSSLAAATHASDTGTTVREAAGTTSWTTATVSAAAPTGATWGIMVAVVEGTSAAGETHQIRSPLVYLSQGGSVTTNADGSQDITFNFGNIGTAAVGANPTAGDTLLIYAQVTDAVTGAVSPVSLPAVVRFGDPPSIITPNATGQAGAPAFGFVFSQGAGGQAEKQWAISVADNTGKVVASSGTHTDTANQFTPVCNPPLVNGTHYTFTITAASLDVPYPGSTNATSATATYTPALAPPSAPTGAAANTVVPTHFTLSWTNPANTVGNRIWYRATGTTAWSLLTSVTNGVGLQSAELIALLAFNVSYDFAITAYDVNAAESAQTVSLTGIAAVTTSYWLRDPISGLAAAVSIKAGSLTDAPKKDGTVHYPLGRALAVVVTGDVHGRESSMTLLTASETEDANLMALLELQTPLFFEEGPGRGQRRVYVTADSAQDAAYMVVKNASWREHAVTFLEV